MSAAVPPGQQELDDDALRQLGELTRELMAARPGAIEEYKRFLAIRSRGLVLPEDDLDAWLRGKTVLVLGGTGCIGSELMAQVQIRCPERLVSVSRGITGHWPRVDSAEYLTADIRDPWRLAEVFDQVRPDLVFHVAAQRDPGLAEFQVHRTLTTNVLGARNVISAATEFGVGQVVFASTGKALRPYSPDVYTASKRVAEWLMAEAAAQDGPVFSAGRFTHVVDNSIVHRKLRQWCKSGVVRLHSPDIAFYGQSALESAQLLMAAGLGAKAGELRLHVISDLGWPLSLLDLTLGVLSSTGSATPVYFSGYDAGYESVPFPGLYDPLTAGDVSPLISAIEAPLTYQTAGGMVDAFPLQLTHGTEMGELMHALDDACCSTQHPAVLRQALDELSWCLLDATLSAVDPVVLRRVARLTQRHQGSLSPEHKRILAAFERHSVIAEFV